MEMSKLEIAGRYKRARNKKEQIRILSELNDCDKAEIEGVLKEMGAMNEENKKPARRKAVKEDKTENMPKAAVESKTVKKLPKSVENAISDKILECQEIIDEQEEKMNELNEFLAEFKAV